MNIKSLCTGVAIGAVAVLAIRPITYVAMDLKTMVAETAPALGLKSHNSPATFASDQKTKNAVMYGVGSLVVGAGVIGRLRAR